MKNIVNILILLLFNISIAQDFLKITNGCSSIQIKIKHNSTGNLYYVIYKTDVSASPTGAELKTLATGSTTTNIEKKDKIILNTSNYNDTIIRSIINIPVVTNNTPKSLFAYTVFENSDGSFGVVNRQLLTFYRKQPAFTFQSTTLNTTATTVNYLVYLPESYYHNPNKKYPMIVFFHGDGQKGDNVDQVRTDALPNYLDGSLNLDFIVISPQQNGWKQTWDKPSFVQELIDLTKSNYRVDDEKIYGIGCSGGGGGMYRYVLQYPENLVAIAPFSGTNIFNNNICVIKNIPFWGFHSLNDGTVVYNGFKNIVNDLTACPPIIPVTKTVYNSSAHDCWKWGLKQDSVYRFFHSKSILNKTNMVKPLVFDTNLTVYKNSNGVAIVDFQQLENDPNYEYFWYQISGSDVGLSNVNSRVFSLINPVAGVYKFRVIVKRNNANVNYRDVLITVSNSVITETDDQLTNQYLENWEIYNLNGNLIKSGKNSYPNLVDLKKGFYFLKSFNKTIKFIL